MTACGFPLPTLTSTETCSLPSGCSSLFPCQSLKPLSKPARVWVYPPGTHWVGTATNICIQQEKDSLVSWPFVFVALSVGRTHPDAPRAAFAFSTGSMALVAHSHPLMNYLTRIPCFRLLSPKLTAESLLLFPKQIILILEPQTSGNCFYLIWLCITGAYQHCVVG